VGTACTIKILNFRDFSLVANLIKDSLKEFNFEVWSVIFTPL